MIAYFLCHIYFLSFCVSALTSDGSQSGYDARAGGWRGALTPLGLPLVHAGRRLYGDLMLKACRTRREEHVAKIVVSTIVLHIIK